MNDAQAEASRPRRERPRRAPSPDADRREGVRMFVSDAPVDVPSIALRAAEVGGQPVMNGYFAVFNRWTEIDSFFEGRFLESFDPGAFAKTFKENRDTMRALFQHGHDPQIGSKPLGPIAELEEKSRGAYYEVPLLDAPYVREMVLPGLKAGLYGASFRFRVMREEVDKAPKRSAHNPEGIQERVVKEARVMEFGPVTFPAYPDASAGVRSVTDEFFLEGIATGDPECVRAAAEGGTFSMFMAHRFGVRAEDEGETEERAGAEEPEASGEVEGAEASDVAEVDAADGEPERAQDEDEPEAERDAEPEAEKRQPVEPANPSTSTAAPGPSPTPLLGVRKEQWRL